MSCCYYCCSVTFLIIICSCSYRPHSSIAPYLQLAIIQTDISPPAWLHISTSKRTVLSSFLSWFYPEPDSSWDDFRRAEANVSHQLICAFLWNQKADMSLLKPESSPCVYYRRVRLLPGSLSILQHLSCTEVASFHSFSAGVSIKIHFSVSFNKQSSALHCSGRGCQQQTFFHFTE